MKVYTCPACGSAPMIKKKMNKYGEFYTTVGCQRCDRFLITEEQKDSSEIYKEWDEWAERIYGLNGMDEAKVNPIPGLIIEIKNGDGDILSLYERNLKAEEFGVSKKYATEDDFRYEMAAWLYEVFFDTREERIARECAEKTGNFKWGDEVER